MSVSLQRLRELKRQSGTATMPQQAAAPARTVSPTIDHLRALLRMRERPTVACARREVDRSLPGREIAPGLYLIEATLPGHAVPASLCGQFARRDVIDTARVLFFDTETTGLAGGVGTRAFMIGAAHWSDGCLHVRQLLTATLGAESAMLDAFASWLHPHTLLASYNGRCYDAPLLRARYRLARKSDPTSGLDHLDLLFPTRRRYRGVWENCRLATIERRALGIVREDDLPGSEAPAAWLGYLRGGDSGLLRRVAQHNHQDVVTLAQLTLHLSHTGSGPHA